MNRLLSIVITLCLTSAFACSSSQKVDLFRVNDNGEVVNIGASQDDNVLYGHFMSKNAYQRARLSMTKPSEDSVIPVCYIELSQGDGIRIEPCANAVMLNEGPALNAPEQLDVIGIYHVEAAPWGTYDLYQFVEGTWKKRFSAPILDEHWQSGMDVIRRDPSSPDRVFLTTSQSDSEGKISLHKALVPMETVLEFENVHVKVETAPAQKTNEPSADLEKNASVDIHEVAVMPTDAAAAMPTDAAAADASNVAAQDSGDRE